MKKKTAADTTFVSQGAKFAPAGGGSLNKKRKKDSSCGGGSKKVFFRAPFVGESGTCLITPGSQV